MQGKTWKGDNDTAVIIIQGWTSYLRQIDPLAKTLNEKGYWIYAPVLSGHNSSPEKLEGITWQVWKKDVAKAIAKIKKLKQIKKVFILGVSFGGNLAILASKEKKVDGVILISTPIFLRDHYWTILTAKILSYFKKNMQKRYSKSLISKIKKPTSYYYFPIKSSLECFKLIRESRKALGFISAPFFIIQTKSDYLVAPYSPLLMYNKIKSKQKSLYWMETKEGVHIDFVTNPKQYGKVISDFIKK